MTVRHKLKPSDWVQCSAHLNTEGPILFRTFNLFLLGDNKYLFSYLHALSEFIFSWIMSKVKCYQHGREYESAKKMTTNHSHFMVFIGCISEVITCVWLTSYLKEQSYFTTGTGKTKKNNNTNRSFSKGKHKCALCAHSVRRINYQSISHIALSV